MTVTNDTTTPSPTGNLRIALIVLAAIEAASALPGIFGIFNDYGHTTALLKFAQALGSVNLALAPLFALAALYLAAAGNVRYAIIAIAIRILVSWVCELPSIAIHGLELSTNFGGLTVFAQYFIAPVVGLAALLLALRNMHLWIAAILVASPSLAAWGSALAFAIAVMIYGF